MNDRLLQYSGWIATIDYTKIYKTVQISKTLHKTSAK